MTILLTQVGSMLARWNNAILVEQSVENNALIEEGIIPKLNKPHMQGIINVKAGEHGSIGTIANGGTLPTGDDVQPAQASYFGVGMMGRLSIPRETLDAAQGLEDGIDIVKSEMESCGAGLGRQLGAMLYHSGNLGSPATTTTANSSTTFEVADPTGWRVGMAFMLYRGSTPEEGHTEATKMRVTDVARPDPGAGGNTTITFTASGTGNACSISWLTTDTLYMRGAYTQSIKSLLDVTAAADLHGVACTVAGWNGTRDATTTTLSIPALDALRVAHRQKRGKAFSKSVTSIANVQRYLNQLQGQIQYVSGKIDSSGMKPEYYGRPIIEDDNCPDAQWHLVTDGDLQLHVYREFSPEMVGLKKVGMDRAAIIPSDTTNTYDAQIRGTFQLRPNRRNGVASFTALAA